MKRVATVAVFHNGKLLMGKRRDNGRETTPGGHLEPKEFPEDGAIRELDEESGIEAETHQLKQVGHSTVTKPDGSKIEIWAYRLDLDDKVPTTMRHDPDGEVHRWRWIDVSRGLPQQIADNLHVPLEHNVLMKGLHMEKRAFWVGFDKQAELAKEAIVPGLSMAGLGHAAMSAGRSGLAAASRVVRAHPGKTLAAGAGLGAAGFAAGRASAPNGPRYPY